MENGSIAGVDARTLRVNELYAETEQTVFRRTDRLFLLLIAAQWIAAIVLAVTVSPRAWSGSESVSHPHVLAAVVLGGLFSVPAMFLAIRFPGQPITRHVIAVAQTCFSALLIHLTGGRLESHFHVFGSLAFLACYRDWRVLMTATAVVLVDHLARGIWFPRSVYGVMIASPWRVAEHALWVIFEVGVLIWACTMSRREMRSICRERAANEELALNLELRVQRRTSELRNREAQLVSMIENSGCIVIGLRPDRTVFEWNREAERILGWTRHEAIGQDYFQLALPESLHDTIAREMEKTLQGTSLHNYENLVTTRDGRQRTILWNVSSALARDGRTAGIIAFGQDITERKLAEEKLVHAKEEAEAGNRAKSEFLAVMSHEIRTPMNGVIGFANLLLDTPLSAEQLEFARTIKSSGEALLTLINDILDFSKIEARKLVVEPIRFDARHAVQEVVDLCSPEADRKNLRLAICFAPDAPQFLLSDPGRFRQILLNLVGNAIKFTARGQVRIEVQRATSDTRWPNGGFRCSVIDTGIGIPKDKQSVLFQQFTQADASTTRRFGGTGLGLAISKRLSELLGGILEFSSEESRGSTFTFTLPITAGAEQEPAPQPPGQETPTRARSCVRVLLAEDNSVNQRLATRILETLGCVVDAVADGREAVQMCEQFSYDLVFMDCLMPVMDGYSATEQIRSRFPASDLPIIALTANAIHDNLEKCLAAGMNDFLSKPVRKEEIRRALDRWARGRAETAMAAAQ